MKSSLLAPVTLVHTFNPRVNGGRGGRGRQISEFKVSLVYRASSRTARAVKQRNLVSKNKQTKDKNKNKQTNKS